MKNDHLVHIQFESNRSLQEQIREHVIAQIKSGIYVENALPSCRKMASMLRVSRNTVVLAYDKLVDEGYLYSHERSGYFVNPAAQYMEGVDVQEIAPKEDKCTGAQQFWCSKIQTNLKLQRNISKPANWRSYPYPFIYGQPDQNLFPLSQWRECGRLANRNTVIKDWVADYIDHDDPMLIEQIQKNVLSKRGITAKPDEILITIGTQNSLYLLAGLLVGKHTIVGVEDPGYPDVRNIFSHHHAKVQPLAIDHEGVVPNALLRQCDYVFVTPSHQVPTNITMSMARRSELIELAQTEDFVIIEDDYDSEINVIGHPHPSLKSLDESGRVIYVGSLSKSLSPGLRMGFMVADRTLIAEARKLRRLMYRHPPANNQRTCALFIAQGHYDSYLRRLRSSYKEKWQAMQSAIHRYLPDCVITNTQGGSSFWLKLPANFEAQKFAITAREHGVLFEAGQIHFNNLTEDSYRYVRLGYSAIALDKIDRGIEKIAQLLSPPHAITA